MRVHWVSKDPPFTGCVDCATDACSLIFDPYEVAANRFELV